MFRISNIGLLSILFLCSISCSSSRSPDISNLEDSLILIHDYAMSQSEEVVLRRRKLELVNIQLDSLTKHILV